MSPPPGPPRVLLVTPYPPTPPLGGGRRRQLELLRWLAQRCELTLATVVFGDEDVRALESVVPAEVRVLHGRPVRGALTRRLPLALQWCWSAKLAELIESEHARSGFDAVVVSHSYSFVYAENLGARTVVDAQNVESRLFDQFSRLPRTERALIRRLAGKAGLGFIGASRTAAAVARLERSVWGRAGAVLCVSREEQAMVAEVAGPGSLYVPNCPSEAPTEDTGQGVRRPVVTFAGSLDYLPNIDAAALLADRIAPGVRSMIPDAKVIVAGRRPTERLIRYCKDRNVEVIADPVSMHKVVAGSVSLCPARLAGGTRLKILDARAQGLPVVATPAAVEGLALAGDPGLRICERVEDFPAQVAELMDAPPPPPPARTEMSWKQAWEPLGSILNLPAG